MGRSRVWSRSRSSCLTPSTRLISSSPHRPHRGTLEPIQCSPEVRKNGTRMLPYKDGGPPRLGGSRPCRKDGSRNRMLEWAVTRRKSPVTATGDRSSEHWKGPYTLSSRTRPTALVPPPARSGRSSRATHDLGRLVGTRRPSNVPKNAKNK